MKNEITKFVKESVEWLIKNQQGCCRYQLDEHLAIFVGWSSGYGKELRNDIIQAKDDPDWGIDAGIKVWTSDYMLTDYDWINFPYAKDGDVLDMSQTISPNEDYEQLARFLLEMYEEVKYLELNDDGMIIEEEKVC